MMMSMMVARLRGRLRARTRSRAIAVGTILIAGSYGVGAAPKFGSGTSTYILGVVRSRTRFMPAAGVGLLLLFPLGRIQAEHVQQNGGHICHHDEGNEHNEPRKNG
jgi:hypothetical protein